MNPVPGDPLLSTALDVAMKTALILGAAALADGVLCRRASAAVRHLVWTMAIGSVLLLPPLTLLLPSWGIAIGPGPAVNAVAEAPAVPDRVHAPSAPAQSRAAATLVVEPTPELPRAGAVVRSVPAAIVAVYLIGLLAMLFHAALQHYRVRRLLRRAAAVDDPEWARALRECAAVMGVCRPVRLMRSAVCSMPMTVCTRRPAIVVPVTADTWPENRRRAVLLHELAHVARFDCLTQALAIVARAIHWVQPAAWWAARRLRIERELACDDLVIAAGAPPRDYAGHLLEIAYAFAAHRAPALAVSMARPGQLETRILAALDAARNRRVPARWTRAAAAALAALLIVPLASITTTAGAPAEGAESTEEGPFSRISDVLPAQLRALPPQARALPPQARALPPQGRALPPELRSTGELRAAARRILRDAAAAFGLQAPKGTGTWEVRPSKAGDGTVHLRLVEGDSSWGRSVRLERLEGLTAAQLSGGGPVQFRLRRDAGTLTFEGVARGGVAAGTFSFAPDPAFADGLAKRGFARPTASEQYALARADVGYAFVDELAKQGYTKPSTAELVRSGEHGVDTEYLREMGALGYRLGTLAPLIELRDHGVGPEYIRALAALGYKGLAAEELRRARDHGVSADYVAAMKEAGYGSLSIAQLINARDHGVSADYVRAMAAAGYTKLPVDELVNARDHGVSDDYVREMRALGYQVLLGDLVRARDHGVSSDFAREIGALGYRGQPIDVLIRLRDHGVTPGYVQELKALGYEGLSTDELVRLRDHGLTAERIRAANARAGTRLPVDRLVSLASGGMR